MASKLVSHLVSSWHSPTCHRSDYTIQTSLTAPRPPSRGSVGARAAVKRTSRRVSHAPVSDHAIIAG
jgi:hypothetical protein